MHHVKDVILDVHDRTTYDGEIIFILKAFPASSRSMEDVLKEYLKDYCTDDNIIMAQAGTLHLIPEGLGFKDVYSVINTESKVLFSCGFKNIIFNRIAGHSFGNQDIYIYYNNKAKSIVNLAKELVENFQGNLPKDFDTLIKLPGIGRKTASVFLNVAYHAPYIGGDTHVFRLVHRLKIGVGKTPQEVQEKLEQIVPEKYKPDFALAMVLLGRYICTARKPKCAECPMYEVCDSDEKE